MTWITLPFIAACILTGLTIIGAIHLLHTHHTRSRPTAGPHPVIPPTSVGELTADHADQS